MTFLRRLFPTRATLVTAILAFLFSLAIGFLPLFGTPGYELSIAVGLVLPSLAAIGVALEMSGDTDAAPFDAIGKGAWFGALLFGLALFTSLVHTLRSGACDLPGGILYFALTAGAGVVLGGVWGGVVSEVARRVKRRRLVAVLLALAGPLGSIAISIARFESSPMIFAFDPFVGYFSGTLYDTIIDPGVALYTYRIGSLATLAAALLVSSAIEPVGKWYAVRARAGLPFALGIIAAGVSVYVSVMGESLGHHSSPRSIEVKLGARKNGTRCDVIYPSTVSDEDAALVLRDCEEDVAMVEDALGARGPDKITAFFFRDAAQKRELMGAEHTYVAKPWRKEVYLQLSQYPHPVLAHELAHVVAGSFGRGPFRIAGKWGGYLPNPGLIEGVAVAASPEDDVLSDDEWARAMKDAKILPPIRGIFSLDFLAGASSRSYTVAGSFIRFLMQSRGKEVVRAWYSGGDIEVLAHASWSALETEYFAFLDKLVLRPEAVRVAEARFGRPGIFGRKCPHVVDEARRDGDRCRDTHDFGKAIEAYDRALSVDARDLGTRYARAQMIARWMNEQDGRPALLTLANDESAPSSFRDRADEALGDLDLLRGRGDANMYYARAHARSLDEDFLRNLDVKMLATRDPSVREIVVPLLLGDEAHTPDAFVFGLDFGLAETKSDGALVHYLVARNFMSRNRWQDTLRELDAMKALPPVSLESVAREAVRMEAVCACAIADKPRIEASKKRAADSLQGGRRDAVLRMLSRCAH